VIDSDRKGNPSAPGQLALACGLSLLCCAFLVLPRLLAQTEPALGDVARQARGQHKAEEQAGTKTSDQAKHLAAELEQEDTEQPPTGFGLYRSQEYRLWVPAPFSVEGRDDNGELLATASESGVKTYVFAANPISANAGLEEVEFNELVRAFWRPYGGLVCAKGQNFLHRCSAGGRLLGVAIPSASVQFLQHESEIVPVFCFHTYERPAALAQNNGRWLSREQIRLLQSGYGAEQASARDCETVFSSVRVREHEVAGTKPMPPPKSAAKQTVAFGNQEVAVDQGNAPSLGEVARATRRETVEQPSAKHSLENDGELNPAPSGFRALSKTLCGVTCWQESLFVPANGKRLDAGAYLVPLDDHTFGAIAFGSGSFPTAFATVAKFIGQPVPTGDEPSTRPVKINGEDATVERRRLSSKHEVWIETHLSLSAPPTNYQIACLAPENRFADMEPICTTVFDSLRLK
jgi:hypothetical protein